MYLTTISAYNQIVLRVLPLYRCAVHSAYYAGLYSAFVAGQLLEIRGCAEFSKHHSNADLRVFLQVCSFRTNFS